MRVIPITPALYALLKQKQVERLFKPSMNAFRTAIDKSALQLPNGQLTHVLRHMFASHFIINGGNILALQKILGHSTLAMTIKYAHLAPEYLQETVRLNPVANLLPLDERALTIQSDIQAT